MWDQRRIRKWRSAGERPGERPGGRMRIQGGWSRRFMNGTSEVNNGE